MVNLLVTPEQAEILTLAGNEGKITLILRNAIDQKTDPVPVHETAELYNGFHKPQPVVVAKAAAPRPRPVAPPAAVAPPPPPPPAPVVVPDEIIMIRGNAKTVETIGSKKQ